MNKILLTALFTTFAFSSVAQANWYVQGEAGLSRVKAGDMKDGRLVPTAAVGYNLSDFRVAVDYTDYGKLKDSASIGGEVTNSSLKVNGVGVSAIYDIEMNSSVKPYVGVRVSQNFVDYKENTHSRNAQASYSDKANKLGYGVLAGVEYGLTKAISVNGGVEYNRLGEINDTSIKQYGAKAGVRYQF